MVKKNIDIEQFISIRNKPEENILAQLLLNSYH